MGNIFFMWGKWRANIFLSSGLLLTILFATSCAKGFDGNEVFMSTVTNTQLESPGADKVKISIVVNAKGEEEFKFEWPVIYGAGGYQFSFYIVDDPDNPVAVGEENQILDKCHTQRAKQEDTKYKIVIKTLGSEKYNNKEALAATEINHSTLVPAMTVPDRTNLTEFFASNPITGTEPETAYELAAGGTYTVSGDIDFGSKSVIIRGDKINHAKITLSSAKLISKGAGIKFKFVDFDFSEKANELIEYGDPAEDIPTQGSQPYAVASPVAFEFCNFSGMTYRIISSASTKHYFIYSLTIKNCIFDMKLSSLFIYFAGNAYIKDFTIVNTTFNNQKGASTSQSFLQYGNGSIAKSGVFAASLIMTNNTFYNVSYSQKIATYNMMRQSTYTITAKKNIFVDCGDGNVIHQFAGGQTQANRICDQNAYWYNASFPQTEITNTAGDKSGTHYEVDPGFANPDAGDFTISASQLITDGIGDPRWLPAQ